jgi:hypothetical protein
MLTNPTLTIVRNMGKFIVKDFEKEKNNLINK